MNISGKYWFLILLLLTVSCVDNLLVISQTVSPAYAFLIAFATSLAGWAWFMKSLKHDQQQIAACLRNPELARPDFQRKNFYGSVFAEAMHKMEESDTELSTTNQVKTMLKARVNSLLKKEALVESVLDNLEIGILVFDAKQELEFTNQAANSFLLAGADQNQSTSESGLSLGKPVVEQTVIPELAKLLAKTIERKEATFRRRTEFEFTSNGISNQYRAIATNLTDENQVALGTVVVVENIGVEADEKTQHAEFVSSVAHELKTPMSEIKRHEHELNDILKTAADVISPTATEKDIKFTAELSDMYLPVFADKDMLGQAIINLLSNAVKYTPNGREVRLRSRMEDTSAVIEVRDTGMGIPENSLPHIFDRFYRVPENNRSAAGTGLGLALVHFIVTNVHNGSISVQSQVDEGACFTVTIPLGHKEQKRKKQLAPPANA